MTTHHDHSLLVGEQAAAAPLPIAGKRASVDLVREVRERYGVGELFARAYLDFWFRGGARVASSLGELLSQPAPLPMQFEHAMTASSRGAQLVHLLRDRLHAPGRCLDVGCGMGGALVAFAAAGFDVQGIDVDGERVRLATANCGDHRLGDVVRCESILSPGLPQRLGRFDLITMIDVIEHVDDVDLALRQAISMLSTKGLLVLDIPNRDSVVAVASDRLFALFGTTQSERPDALRYHAALTAAPYGVSVFHRREHYRRLLEELGCVCEELHPAPAPADRFRGLPSLLRRLGAEHRQFRRAVAPRLDNDVAALVELRYEAYCAGLARDLLRALVRPRLRPLFANRYLKSFWTLTARPTREQAPLPQGRPASKVRAELEWWQWWIGTHGGGRDNIEYYRSFMMTMGGLSDPHVFAGLICLDIGCGPLGSLEWLVEAGARAALGLDPLSDAYLQLGIAEHRMTYLRAGAEQIPLATGYVDVVFSMNSLDHVDDPLAACGEIRRVLKPGGWFIGSLNLDEPATDTEPWTLTEDFLARYLFAGWEREHYRVRPKAPELGDEYRYFTSDSPSDSGPAGRPRALWCRFRVPPSAVARPRDER
jgi:2-polyprenyl-3-methyl-5-hydroxy-6-metoxy-1,4-benzoquinol methylase